LIIISVLFCCIVFLFQAEDGIRDRNVTGVQTCALPISISSRVVQLRWLPEMFRIIFEKPETLEDGKKGISSFQAFAISAASRVRSEERRVGKEYRSRRARSQ